MSTKKKILIALGTAVTVLLILLLVGFIVFYVYQVMEKNAEHTKLRHCVPMIDAASRLENELNVTQRFLRSPEEYKEIADKCDEAIKCVASIETTVSADVLHTFSPCQFYVYYNREFSTCAHQLIAKKDDGVACLHTLFNDVYEPDVDECRQWDGMQECVRTQIKETCGDNAVTRRYRTEAANLRQSICT